MPESVAIVGGGLAGLSAAVELAGAGVPCTLFEKRPYLGGRVSSFRDPKTGWTLDNGPHLLAGAYHATRQFLQKIGSLEKIHFQPRLQVPYFDTQKGWAALKAASLPPPFHLLSALTKFPLLKQVERARVLKALVALQRLPETASLDALALSDWLESQRQPPAARRFFWDVLALATLNALPEAVSLLNFHRVLHRAFFSGKENARLAWATEPFQEIFAGPAEAFLIHNGAQILKAQPVLGVKVKPNRAAVLVGKEGELGSFEQVILALPPTQAEALLRPHWPELSLAEAANPSPIITVHLFLKKKAFSPPFLAFVDGTAQWIFYLNALHTRPSWEGHFYSAVVSGAVRESALGKAELVQAVFRDLRGIQPNLNESDILHSRVVKEMAGTQVFPPGGEQHRPGAETPFPILFLAGGWTRTGLPDTLESAVISGKLAAAKVLTRLG